MFGIPKDIAHKMVINGNYVLHKIFINFHKSQFPTGRTNNSKNNSKPAKRATIWAQKPLEMTYPRNDLEMVINS